MDIANQDSVVRIRNTRNQSSNDPLAARGSNGATLRGRSGTGGGPKSISAAQIDNALRSASARRDVSLRALFSGNLARMQSPPPPFAEDNRGLVEGYHMAFNNDGASAEYIRTVAEAGVEQDFRVYVTAEPTERGFVDSFPENIRNNVVFVDVEIDAKKRSPWTEDNAISHENGSLSVMPPLGDTEALSVARANKQGRVASLDGHREQVGFALATGGSARIALSYIEGGNVLAGTRNGEPYAVVGQGSFDVTHALLTQEAERLGVDTPVTDAMVEQAIAFDLGLSPEQLVKVDQPDFHVDVAMMPWGDGQVVLDDPGAALSTQRVDVASTLEELRNAAAAEAENPEASALLDRVIGAVRSGNSDSLRSALGGLSAISDGPWKTAADQAMWEGLTIFHLERRAADYGPKLEAVAQQLRAAGLDVVPAPGRFYEFRDAGLKEVANLLNSEGGMSPSGEHYLITQETGQSRRDAFSTALESRGVVLPTIYGVPETAACTSLENSGSVNCRTTKIPLRQR